MELHKIKSEEVVKPPTPEQMFALASATVCAAKETGKKKPSSRAERAHILMPKNLELYQANDDGGYMHVTHRFFGRIGRIDYRRWRMRLIEPYWVNTEEESASYRSIRTFEWTDRDVITAAKRVIVAESADDREYGLQPAAVDESIFLPDFVHAINQYENLSRADCDLLIDDVRAFSAQSIKNLQYVG